MDVNFFYNDDDDCLETLAALWTDPRSRTVAASRLAGGTSERACRRILLQSSVRLRQWVSLKINGVEIYENDVR